jgi:hypothetical protein
MSATTTTRIGLSAPTFDLPPRFLSELLEDPKKLFSPEIAPLSEDIEAILRTDDPIKRAQLAMAFLKRESITYVRVLYLYDALGIMEKAAAGLKEKEEKTKAATESLTNTTYELQHTLAIIRSGNVTYERRKRVRGTYVCSDPE